jgi:hypothetical protein
LTVERTPPFILKLPYSKNGLTMSKFKFPKTVFSNRFAWLAAALCVGCCAIVPALVLFGIAGAASLGIYFEFAAAGFFIASVIIFGYLIFKSKKPLCKTDCVCRDSSV